MPILYQIASYVLFLVALPLLLTHPKLRNGLRERFGFYPPLPSRGAPRIWLHGASAGDLLALKPIVEGLRHRLPTATLVVSTLTNSGRLMGRERLRAADAVVYLPYDLPGATRRAVRRLAPDLLVLEYTEVWPNLIRAAKRAGARVAITNGRFSPRTFRSYRLLFGLTGNPLRLIDALLMRTDEEADRAVALGAPRDRVQITGNTKFDSLAAASEQPLPDELRRLVGDGPLFVAGSTHAGEEELLLAVLARLRVTFPALRMLIAPRYIDRAAGIQTLARDRGFSARLRSTGPGDATDVVVLDSIGELSIIYPLADIVFVGGSFTARGGQNILEPAAAGKPVLFGPNMENFADSVQVLLGRGGIQVRDQDHLFQVVNELLSQPQQLRELGELARAAVSSVRGASERDVEALCALLSLPKARR